MWSNPSNLMNFLSNYLLIIIITRFYGAAVTGIYVFPTNFLEIPLGLVSSPIQDIFTQNAASEIDINGDAKLSFKQTFITLLLIAIFIIPIILFMSGYISFVFGMEWRGSEKIIGSILFIVCTRFISSPLSMIWIIRKKEKLNFIWQLLLIFFVFTSLIIPFYFFEIKSIFELLSIYSFCVGLWYILAIFASYKISNLKSKKKSELFIY